MTARPDSGSSNVLSRLLLGSFHAAVAAADPLYIVAEHLPAPPRGRVVVVGAGKAAASMARAVELAWSGKVDLRGVVITRYGHGLPTEFIRVVEAGHPVPDQAGEQAAAEILALAQGLGPDDLLLVLLSGGGSSLMSLPAPGLGMAALKAVNRELLRCGAPITEMNIVRKHLSAISGGRLAAATQARVLALIVSDVTGDDVSAIASGPCAPDTSTYQDAVDIVARHSLTLPGEVREHLRQGAAGHIAETPKPGEALFERVENRVIASAHQSLEAGARFLSDRGMPVAILGDTVTGEAREVAKVYAALVREIRQFRQPWKAPIALISGGECTVTMRAENAAVRRGGRCTEFLLALALELNGMSNVHALACDTDGIDGSQDNAGALLAPDTLTRAAARGCPGQAQLDANDAWGFFDAAGSLVVTGPTRTNVNDYRIILVL